MKDTLFSIIGIILTTLGAYAVGAFITLDPLWFYTSTIARIIAVILFFTIVGANIKALNE